MRATVRCFKCTTAMTRRGLERGAALIIPFGLLGGATLLSVGISIPNAPHWSLIGPAAILLPLAFITIWIDT